MRTINDCYILAKIPPFSLPSSSAQGTTEALHGSADLTLLLVSRSKYCGTSTYKDHSPFFPVAVVSDSCALNHFGAGREIGENLGAWSQAGREGDGGYGRGWTLHGTNKRTIVA